MLAGPNVSLETMRRAVAHTIAALGAAAKIDVDRSDDDRGFYAAQRAKLEPLATSLAGIARSLEEHDLGPGMLAQVSVVLGDAVMDRGVRTGNQRTKIGLKDHPGLGASHVFGTRVDDLVREPLRVEPAAVLKAADRLEDVHPFEGRDAIRDDLRVRATQQETLLADRDVAEQERGRIASASVRVVTEAAEMLARVKGALDERFPRQRDYVSTFFFDVAKVRARTKGDAPAPA